MICAELRRSFTTTNVHQQQKNTPADAPQRKLAVSLFCVQAFLGLGMALGITSPSSLGTTRSTPGRSFHHSTTADVRLNAPPLHHRRASSRRSSICRRVLASSTDPDAQADRLWNQAIQQQQSPQTAETLFELTRPSSWHLRHLTESRCHLQKCQTARSRVS